MDTIETKLDDNFGDECLFIFVNGERLDKLLSRRTGENELLNLVPAWSDMYRGFPEEQMDHIWSHSRIDDGIKVLPLLLCPDDYSFDCTTVVVEVTPHADTIEWNRFGFDTTGFPNYIGETVHFLAGAGSF